MSIMRKIIVVFFFSLFLSSVSFAQASYKQTDILKAYKEARISELKKICGRPTFFTGFYSEI